MRYKIFQIKDIANVNYAFRNYIEKEFSLDDYKLVGKGTVLVNGNVEGDYTDDDALEDLFVFFNENKPVYFEGRSLSVSDVVSLDGRLYYCESFGWKRIA